MGVRECCDRISTGRLGFHTSHSTHPSIVVRLIPLARSQPLNLLPSVLSRHLHACRDVSGARKSGAARPCGQPRPAALTTQADADVPSRPVRLGLRRSIDFRGAHSSIVLSFRMWN